MHYACRHSPLFYRTFVVLANKIFRNSKDSKSGFGRVEKLFHFSNGRNIVLVLGVKWKEKIENSLLFTPDRNKLI